MASLSDPLDAKLPRHYLAVERC